MNNIILEKGIFVLIGFCVGCGVVNIAHNWVLGKEVVSLRKAIVILSEKVDSISVIQASTKVQSSQIKSDKKPNFKVQPSTKTKK